jgi:MFS family permease
VRQLLAHRGFRRLLVGQAISSFGDWMGTLALMYFVLELSGSTTAVGGVLVLRLLPSAVGAPLAARVVVRWDRRRVMLRADLIRAGMALLLPVVPWLGWVFWWAFAIEVVSLAFLPARDAAVPVLLDGDDQERQLTLANGLVLGTTYGGIPLAAAAFGLLDSVAEHAGWGGQWRYVVVFWVDALTYLASYAAVRSIPDLTSSREARQDAAKRGRATQEPNGPSRREGGSGGVLQALRIPIVRSILPGVVTVAAGLGALFSLGVPFVQDVLGAGGLQFGLLVALFGVGATIGIGAMWRLGGVEPVARIRMAVALQGVVIAAMGVLATVGWAFAGAVAFGAGATAALISAMTLLQEKLAGAQRNLALTAFHASLRFGLAGSAMIAGALADVVGRFHADGLGTVAPVRAVLVASGLVVLAGSAIVRRPGGGEREAGGAEREVSEVDLDERYEVEKRGPAKTQPRPGRRG